MQTEKLEQLVRELCGHPAMQKLDALLREQAGVGLIILLPRENERMEVVSAGSETHLPDFCRMVHSAEGGMQRCMTCRSLLAFAAVNQGLVEHTCHGGVSVLAAPVSFLDGGKPELLVVSSCAFGSSTPKAGWRSAKHHAQGLALDARQLRKAYFDLPRLSGSKLSLARHLVDIAATTLTQDIRARSSGAVPEERARPRVEREVSDALRAPSQEDLEVLSRHSGGALIQVVAGVVRRNPALPFSVSDIARAAQMTPNHFSALFTKHMGQSFSTFLVWMRISLAQELMQDLTMTIREAAERAGFTDANYFARRFKQKTGVTPRQWRAAL